MSLKKKLAAIRRKPRRVRERYLLVALAIVAPTLLVVWFFTYHYDASTSGADFFKSISATVTTSFGSPVYKDTFGDTSLFPKQAPAATVPTPTLASGPDTTSAIPTPAPATP